MNAIEIRDLVQTLKHRQRNIDEIEKKACSIGTDWINEIILQGSDLARLKDGLHHYNDLFEQKCDEIGISPSRAQRYSRVALHADKVPQLTDARVLCEQLFLIAEPDAPSIEEPRRWPPHIEAINRCSKMVGFVTRFEFTKWPEESKLNLRNQIRPLVVALGGTMP